MKQNEQNFNMIFSQKITDDQKERAGQLVDSTNFGTRKDGCNGNREMQYTGILGEVVFSDLMSVPRANIKNDEWTIDFVISDKGIDLKTMGRTCDVKPYFVNNVALCQVQQSLADIFLFASINKTTSMIEFCGWLRKKQLADIQVTPKGSMIKRGDGSLLEVRFDMLEVDMTRLNEFNPKTFAEEVKKNTERRVMADDVELLNKCVNAFMTWTPCAFLSDHEQRENARDQVYSLYKTYGIDPIRWAFQNAMGKPDFIKQIRMKYDERCRLARQKAL